jgi:hypothetical protein
VRSKAVSPAGPSLSGGWLCGAAPVVLLCGLVALAYGPAVPNFFVSDDLDMLSGDASDLLSPASGFGRFMPLAAALHRTTAVASGLNPVPPHALQLALHATAALLVYALARQLLADERARPGAANALAFTAALLFALYPRHHQVVMWFGAVSIGVAATLALATAVLFVRAWQDGDARAGWAAAATYTAALLAHESAVVLPLLLATLAVYERAVGHRPPSRVLAIAAGASTPRRPASSARVTADGSGHAGPRLLADLRALPAWLWAMPFASAGHLALLGWAYRARAAAYPDSGYRFLGLGGDLLAAPLRYAAQLVVPPPWTESLALGAPGLALGALALVGAAGWAWRGGALARLGLAWAAAAGAPFVLFGIYGVTDRYYYLPSVGLALALAAALASTGRWRVPIVASYGALAVVLLAQVTAEWRLAGASVRETMDYLAAWAAAPHPTPPEAIAFVGAPFKRAERWPGSQVYVFSTGLVGAAHLATGWPALRVSYVFADEQPALGGWLATLPAAPGPRGLALFDLDAAPPVDRSDVVGSALPELARLKWRGASRTPIDWARYTVEKAPE